MPEEAGNIVFSCSASFCDSTVTGTVLMFESTTVRAYKKWAWQKNWSATMDTIDINTSMTKTYSAHNHDAMSMSHETDLLTD